MRSPALFVAAACLAASASLAALELPAELPLDADSVAIELGNAELAVVVAAASEPTLRARKALASEPGSAGLEAASEGGVLTVRRAAGAEAAPRLRVDAVVAPGQRVRIAGADLVVRVEDPPPLPAAVGAADPEEEDDEEEDRSSALPRAIFELSIEDSQADLSGVHGAVLEATGSALRLERTTGSVALTLAGGSAEIRRHLGGVDLGTTDAEVVLIDSRGRVTPRLRRGSLEVRDSFGTWQGTARDAVLLFDGWRGTVEVRGAGATVEARGADAGTSQWKLEGGQMQVFLEQIQGTVVVSLDGGSLQANGLRAKVEAAGRRRARLELADVAGPVELTLSDGAEAQLVDISGALRAEVTDALLQVDGLVLLNLTAARARISASRIERLAKLEVTDAELDLDLTTVAHSPSLQLQGAGSARVRLPTPCVVSIAGSENPMGYPIEVSSCELRVPGQVISRRQDHLRYGNRRPTTLSVTLNRDIVLEVEGEP